MAISIAPLTTTVMNSVTVQNSGIASGINNAVSRVSGLLAIAALGLLVFITFSHQLDRRLESINIPSQLRQSIEAQKIRLAAIQFPKNVSTKDKVVVKQQVSEAFVVSFRWVSIIGALLALLSALSAILMIGSKEKY